MRLIAVVSLMRLIAVVSLMMAMVLDGARGGYRASRKQRVHRAAPHLAGGLARHLAAQPASDAASPCMRLAVLGVVVVGRIRLIWPIRFI